MSHPVYDTASAAFAAGGVVTLAGDVNGPSNVNHVDTLTGPGTGIVNLATGSFLRLDGTAGTFSAAGFIRSKEYIGSTVLWGGRTTTPADAPILTQATTTLTLGNAAWTTVVVTSGAGGTLVNSTGSILIQPTGVNGVLIRELSAAFVCFTFTTATSAAGEISMQMANSIDPATPTGGPKLYAVSGAAKGIGTSGTITTFAAAEPHCPVCDRDFTTEHENHEKGYGYLAVCLHCLADHIEKTSGPQAWIRREKP